MISKELAKKIRYIQIHTRKMVNDILGGEYQSVFKGRGMAFDEVRAYTPGDEIRTIDWNVTARMGEPYIKRFVEERELTLMLLVDLSASGSFGSVDKNKNEIAAELSALLAFSAIKNNDKVGLIIFTDRIELYVPPAKGTRHVLRLVRDLLDFKPSGTGTNISVALDYLGRVTHKKCVVFLVSDFQDEGFEKPLRVVGRRHDLAALSIADPREQEFPGIGLVELIDAETGEEVVVDTSSRAFRSKYAKLAAQRQEQLQEMFNRTGVDYAPIVTGRDFVRGLVAFFRQRIRRRA